MAQLRIPVEETISWQRPIISILNDPPVTPTKGDRYIVGVGTGQWAGHDTQIAWYGTFWNYDIPIEGWVYYNRDVSKLYVFDGAAWNTLDSVLSLVDADTVDGQHRVLTINADHTHQSTGAMGGQLDHGLALTGLEDDDHPQYQKETDFSAGSILFRGSTAITEDNSNLFWDDTNKRLGIGTTSPTEKLQVAGAIKSTGVITTALANSSVMDYNNGTNFYSYGADPYHRGRFTFNIYNSVGTGDPIGMVISSNGNVGIGTASPTSGVRLDVQAAQCVIHLKGTTNSNGDRHGIVSCLGFNSTDVVIQGGISVGRLYDTTNGELEIFSNPGSAIPIIFSIANAEIARFTVAGNLDLYSGKVLKIAGSQVVGARIIDAAIDDTHDTGFDTLYPAVGGILTAIQSALQTHGLVAAS